MPVVVVASTHPRLAEELEAALAGHDLTPALCRSAPEAVRTVFERGAAAVIVDLRAPEMEPLRLISLLRAASEIAIVAVTDQHDIDDCVNAIDAGADDVTYPDTPTPELVARLRAALRRGRRAETMSFEDGSTVRTGTLCINPATRQVTKRGQPVHLSKTELRLLAALSSQAGQAVSNRVLLSSVWGRALSNDVREVRLYVRYLRSKLEENPSKPRYLLTERGVGYRLALIPVEDDDEPLVQMPRDSGAIPAPRTVSA